MRTTFCAISAVPLLLAASCTAPAQPPPEPGQALVGTWKEVGGASPGRTLAVAPAGVWRLTDADGASVGGWWAAPDERSALFGQAEDLASVLISEGELIVRSGQSGIDRYKREGAEASTATAPTRPVEPRRLASLTQAVAALDGAEGAAVRHLTLARAKDKVQSVYDEAASGFKSAMTFEVFQAFVAQNPILYGAAGPPRMGVREEKGSLVVAGRVSTDAGEAQFTIWTVEEGGAWRVRGLKHETTVYGPGPRGASPGAWGAAPGPIGWARFPRGGAFEGTLGGAPPAGGRPDLIGSWKSGEERWAGHLAIAADGTFQYRSGDSVAPRGRYAALDEAHVLFAQGGDAAQVSVSEAELTLSFEDGRVEKYQRLAADPPALPPPGTPIPATRRLMPLPDAMWVLDRAASGIHEHLSSFPGGTPDDIQKRQYGECAKAFRDAMTYAQFQAFAATNSFVYDSRGPGGSAGLARTTRRAVEGDALVLGVELEKYAGSGSVAVAPYTFWLLEEEGRWKVSGIRSDGPARVLPRK